MEAAEKLRGFHTPCGHVQDIEYIAFHNKNHTLHSCQKQISFNLKIQSTPSIVNNKGIVSKELYEKVQLQLNAK